MKSIIEEIYNVIAEEGKVLRDNGEYRKLTYKNDELYEKFCKELTEEQVKNLDTLLFINIGIESEASEAYFTKGFKLGVLTILECINK